LVCAGREGVREFFRLERAEPKEGPPPRLEILYSRAPLSPSGILSEEWT